LSASEGRPIFHRGHAQTNADNSLFEFGCNTSLFADLVGGYSINFSVSFDWNNLGAVCVYGMVASLPQEAKAAFRQVLDGGHAV
jgi:hypothetical protein